MTTLDRVMRGSGIVAVIRLDEEYKLLSARAVAAGERLFRIEGQLTSVPTRYSVQIGPSTHVDFPVDFDFEDILDRFYMRFMNHNCEPSAAIRGREVFSLRKIEPWEEITFNYNTTEYRLVEPFECYCGSARCAGLISGFGDLDRTAQERLRPHLAAHLVGILDADLDGDIAGVVPLQRS